MSRLGMGLFGGAWLALFWAGASKLWASKFALQNSSSTVHRVLWLNLRQLCNGQLAWIERQRADEFGLRRPPMGRLKKWSATDGLNCDYLPSCYWPRRCNSSAGASHYL